MFLFSLECSITTCELFLAQTGDTFLFETLAAVWKGLNEMGNEMTVFIDSLRTLLLHANNRKSGRMSYVVQID